MGTVVDDGWPPQGHGATAGGEVLDRSGNKRCCSRLDPRLLHPSLLKAAVDVQLFGI